MEYYMVNVISARVSARARGLVSTWARRARAYTSLRAETKGWDRIYHVMLFVSYTLNNALEKKKIKRGK